MSASGERRGTTRRATRASVKRRPLGDTRKARRAFSFDVIFFAARNFIFLFHKNLFFQWKAVRKTPQKAPLQRWPSKRNRKGDPTFNTVRKVLEMRLQIKDTAGIVLAIAAGVFSATQTAAQQLTALTGEYQAHAMPTATAAAAHAGKQDVPSVQSVGLVYHGGPVMTTATTYAIFWAPTKLQDGTPVNMPANYFNLQESLLQMYPGHGIDNNNTQYYMVTTQSRRICGIH